MYRYDPAIRSTTQSATQANRGKNMRVLPAGPLAPVAQKMDRAILRINLYPLNSTIGFPNTYPLDSDLSDE